MECVDFSLIHDRYNILLAVIYRPPDSSVLQFANELAAYLPFKSANKNAQSQCIFRLQNCIEDIQTWMSFNFVKLNEDKTE